MSDPDSISGIHQQGQDQQSVAQKNKRDGDDDDEGDGNERKVRQKGDNEQEQHQEEDQGKKQPTTSDKYNSEDADIRLITSDNVLFRVHSYQLMAASPVFRSMLLLPNSDGQRDHIQLCDELVESGPVVRILLDIIYTSEVDCDEYLTLNLVLDLADKWEFEQVPRIILRELQRHNLDPGLAHIDVFNLAVRMQKPELAASWLKLHHGASWDTSIPATPSLVLAESTRPFYMKVNPSLMGFKYVDEKNIFEVGSWSYESFVKTPPDVTWALLRATTMGTYRSTVDYEVVKVEFEKLLKSAWPKSK